MTTINPIDLSGSTNGLQIAVAAVATPGTLIHTAHATDTDEVHLLAVNNHPTIDRILTIEWGGVVAKDQIKVEVKALDGLIVVLPGSRLSGSLVVRAFADAANDINVQGHVNRITP